MRNSITGRLLSILLLLTGVFYLISCQKDVSGDQGKSVANKEVINKINKWLDDNKKADTSIRNKIKIQAIKDNLDFSKLGFEKLNEKKSFVL